MDKKKLLIAASIGTFSGFINGLLGAGGGIIIVPVLSKFLGLERKFSHANAVFIIFFMCIASSAFYLGLNAFNCHEVLPYLPFGIIGAFLGAYLLPRVNKKVLKIAFGVFSIFVFIRLILK